MSAYPNFGKVKTIVLPIPEFGNFTINQYKEKYGIDLRDILKVEGSEIIVKTNAFILLFDAVGTIWSRYLFPNDFSSVSYEEGSADAELVWIYKDSNGDVSIGIQFFIDKNDPCDIENLKLYRVEL